MLLALVADCPEAIGGVRAETGSASIGVSDPLGRLSRVPEAGREARWALDGARADRVPMVRYGEDASSLLPAGLGGGERLVSRVLGPLLDYDASHETELVASLRTFLESNRSWKDAAAILHIHKQTLVYRMRRVQEMSGCRLDDTGDVAELWIALKALDGAAFLAINGIQTLSHAFIDLSGDLADLVELGVTDIRLSPHSLDMVAVARIFREALDERISAAEARQKIRALDAPGPFANGFFHGRAGHRYVEAAGSA